MKQPVKIKFFDGIIIACTLIFILGSALMIYIPGGSETAFIIEAPGRSWTYPAHAETILHVEGVIGVSMVEIRNGSIRIVSSPCDNQTCVAAGSISRSGQWLACLPNQVFIHVEGKDQHDDNTIDGATW